MPKYAFLVHSFESRKYTYSGAVSMGASVPHLRAGLETRLFMLHNAEPLNRLFELPFKSIWFNKCIDGSKLDTEDEIYFILYESFHMTYSRRFLRFIKRKYRKSKLLYFFANPVSDYNLKRLNGIIDLLDKVFMFNEDDARKYGFAVCKTDVFLLPKLETIEENEYDVFFIGANKGRLPILLSIYEKLHNSGLKCDFWITEVPKEEQRFSDVIHYNQRIPYEEVLSHDCKSRCILEVLEGGKQYSSIRTIEALHYHKKLLTMSDSVKEQWFYNPEIIQVFHSVDEISTEFILKSADSNCFAKEELGSPQLFTEFIEAEMDKGK